MKLYKYKNYEDYKNHQIKANKRKIKKKYDIPTTGPKAERLKKKYDAIYREGRTAVFELDNTGRFKRVE